MIRLELLTSGCSMLPFFYRFTLSNQVLFVIRIAGVLYSLLTTRRIQRLVSTHQLPHKSLIGRRGGGYSRPTQIQIPSIYQVFISGGGGTLDKVRSKVRSPDQIFILRGGGTMDQLKSKVPDPDQIFIGGYSRPTQTQSPKS